MKFWVIVLGIVGILGVFGFLILNNLHAGDNLTASQKQRALTNLLGRAPILSSVDHTIWKTYTSSLVSFVYPSWATVYTKDNTDAKKLSDVADSFHFGLLDQHIEGIVAVTNRPSFSQVSDEPAVTLRLHDSSYLVVSSPSATTVQFMKNADTLERSAFILKNGKIYSLIVSGGGDSDNKEIFEKIQASLQLLSK